MGTLDDLLYGEQNTKMKNEMIERIVIFALSFVLSLLV